MKQILGEMRRNWKSGLTVSLVSVPLSLSLAIAANATPMMGIITAIWAGLFAAAFGGSRFNVVGPTGALSGILAAFALQNGVEMLPILSIASGAVILAVYFLQWERYIVFIPSSVTHGFTLGVAFIIGLNQLNFALGLSGLEQHERFIANVYESVLHSGSAHLPTVLVFLAALALLFLLLKFSRTVPGPVIVAALGMGLGYASERGLLPFSLHTLLTRYGSLDMQLIDLPPLALPPLDPSFVKTTFAIALVAILETLLSAKIADGMTKTRFDQHKEMLGLSLANMASGLAGGIPATAALARTALNVKTGATSQWSSGINAVCVLIISLIFFGWFQYLPLAIVAAILVYVAARMVESEHFTHLYRLDRPMFWLSMVVAGITIVEDPIVGILVGATVALLIFVRQLSKGQSEITIHKGSEFIARVPSSRMEECTHEGDVTVYRLAGELTYFNGRAHEERVKKINACHTIILNLRNLFYIDLDGVDTLQEMVNECEARGKKAIISSAGEFIEPLLSKAPWYQAMRGDNRVFASTTEALNALGFPQRSRK